MSVQVHPSAHVDPDADLADGVCVGPNAVIGGAVVLGKGTEVGAGAQVQGPATFGENNRIFPLACVGFDPQDLKFVGEHSVLEVGDGNSFREYCSVHRGTAGGGGRTEIGDNNLFMTYSHVAHDCRVGSRVVLSNAATLAGHVDVHDDAVISAFSAIHQFCRVGRHAYIGGYSVITKDALPFAKTVGLKPACYGLNRIGMQRKGLTDEIMRQLEKALRTLTRAGLNTQQALEQLRGEDGGVELEYLVEFIETSQRGFIKSVPGKRGERGNNVA